MFEIKKKNDKLTMNAMSGSSVAMWRYSFRMREKGH
jgi:hypothetical protein